MLAQIELTPARAEALARLEQATGESRTALLGRALDSFFEREREYTELAAEVAQAEEELAAGQSRTTAEVMANAMAAIAHVQARKGGK